MKILHTADWHIGQLFHQYDRTYEHQQFLNWLEETLHEQAIDVLLISGDVFDHPNPSAASIRMFYTFLKNVTTNAPNLQIIVTAGNHDSAQRLEAPKPLLESSNIHIIGVVERTTDGQIDYSKLAIPLKDEKDNIIAWCLAIPFLRIGDYPVVQDSTSPYTDGVATFYKEAVAYVKSISKPDEIILAMGHLHAQQAEISDVDVLERPIMGGVECISTSAFDTSIQYVALGHIHKAQCIGGQSHIRYSGSPIPMSFTELHYKHQVVVFDLKDFKIENISSINVPVSIPLVRVPSTHKPLPEVLEALSVLERVDSSAYLEVCVMCDGPEPGLRYQVEKLLENKGYRLTRIDVKYKRDNDTTKDQGTLLHHDIKSFQPISLLENLYQQRFQQDLPETLKNLFQEIVEEVNQKDE